MFTRETVEKVGRFIHHLYVIFLTFRKNCSKNLKNDFFKEPTRSTSQSKNGVNKIFRSKVSTQKVFNTKKRQTKKPFSFDLIGI